MPKKISALVLLVFIMFMSFSSLASFRDTDGHWANMFIADLQSANIINGDGNGNFRPNDYINADEFLKLAITAAGYSAEASGGYWADGFIKTAYEKEIVWEGEFEAFSRPIKRFEIVRIMTRALNLNAQADKSAVIAKISDYYDIKNDLKEYVLAAYSNGLVTGYADGSFRAYENATRAETAVMITRMMKIKPLPIPSLPGTQAPSLKEFFVAVDGNDANNGSIDSPFKSIERAKEAVKAQEDKSGITVNIRGGIYEIEKTLVFENEDSGQVTYTAYNGENVRITGSKPLSYGGFKKISDDMAKNLLSGEAKSKVVQIDLKSQNITDYGKILRRGHLVNETGATQAELFIDGERMRLGRWPNNGYTAIGETVRTGKRSQSAIKDGAVYKYVDNQPSKWKTDIENIFVAGVLGPNYAYDYYPLGGINTRSGEITLREGAIVEYYTKPFVWYENIFEEIDTPGEYYIDREKGILYLYPPAGMNARSDIRLSVLSENIITMNGASGIKFKNLRFDTTRGGVIRGNSATEITIENCEIRNTGNYGISLNGTKNSAVRNCHIYDVGHTGISLGGGDYQNLISGENIVENNRIHKVAQIERSYQTGVTLGYRSVGTVMRHNEIYDTPHTAVIIYGPEHIVEYNDIHDAVTEFIDMDAIYMNVYVYPWERGVTIRNNYIHDLGQLTLLSKQINVAGIRTDNNGSGLNVIGNVFYNIGYKDSNQVRAICAEGTRNIIKNNIFVDTAEAYDGPSPYNSDAKFNIEGNNDWKTAYNEYKSFSKVYGEKYPEILDFWNEHYLAAKKTNIYADNLVVNIKIPISTLNSGYDISGFRAAPELVLSENNYAVTQDPGFVDYNKKNFNLKADSEVFGKISGFKPIEFDKIGIPADEIVGIKE